MATATSMAGRGIGLPTTTTHLSQPNPIVTAITSLLQTLNPQNPNSPIPNPCPLDQFSPQLNPNLVAQVTNHQTNPHHAIFFFRWASNPNPNPNNYSHTHFSYIAITDLLLSHSMFYTASSLLESSNRFSDFILSRFIKAHGDRGNIRGAIHCFHIAKSRELGRCLFSYNSILGVLVRANRLTLARTFFDQIVSEGVVKPDVSTYTTMIRWFCKMGMIDDAMKVFDKMTCEPNLVTYNTIINGLCKKGFMESVLRVVDRMRESKECLPDLVTYTTLIDGYCKRGELDEARKFLEEMVSQNCKPSVVTYNAMIYGLCLNGDVDEAKRMMTRMRLNGLKDNVATHTSLLKGYCVVGRSEEAVKHLKEMDRLGFKPGVKAYGVVVNEYCKMGKPKEAIALLREMSWKGINPSVYSFNAVFRILVDSGEFDRAIHLLKQMPQMGCRPNFMSYNTLICSLCRAIGRMREAEELVHDMLRDGHDPNATTYSCLVEGYSKNENEEMAGQVFLEMINKGYVINLESFCIFSKELCAKGKAFEVQKLLEQMCDKCSVTEVGCYWFTIQQYL